MKGVLFTLKKFSQLQKKLDVLEAQKFDIDSFENLSLFQFLKYKSIISKKSKLKMQMKKSLSEAQKIVSSYKNYKAKLIDNNSINCRKYQKLIKKAEYEANLKLFKLGFISKKPTPPQFQNVCKKINLPISNFFKRFAKNITYVKSTFIPQQIEKVTLNTVKNGIRGYRAIQSNFRLFGKHLSSNECARHIQNIIKKAQAQVNTEDMMNLCNHQHTNKESFYRASLKFDLPNPSAIVQKSTAQKRAPIMKASYLEPDM